MPVSQTKLIFILLQSPSATRANQSIYILHLLLREPGNLLILKVMYNKIFYSAADLKV